VEGVPFGRPPWERCRQMARTLHQRGILAKLRPLIEGEVTSRIYVVYESKK